MIYYLYALLLVKNQFVDYRIACFCPSVLTDSQYIIGLYNLCRRVCEPRVEMRLKG